MGTFWKEIVNFGCGGECCTATLCVFDGEGICKFSLGEQADLQGESGQVVLFLKDSKIIKNIDSKSGEFSFETDARDYFLQMFRGGNLLCEGGNAKLLSADFSISQHLLSDTFEERVATFNYFEKEMGEAGKDCREILKTKLSQKSTNPLCTSAEEVVAKEAEATAEKAEKTAEVERVEEEVAREKTKQNFKGKKKKKDFFEMVEGDVAKLFKKFPREEFLESMLENSKWVCVEFAKGVHYAVGVIYSDDLAMYIGYGIVGKQSEPPKELQNPQFLPLNLEEPNGEGYFLIFQNAKDGSSDSCVASGKSQA